MAASTVERLMRITRLGQGVDATGALAPEAVGRTLDVLREYRAVLDRHGVERVRMTATSAARDASNRDIFFVPAAEIVGTAPELLSGDEEGRLSFAGATAELDPARGPFLVVDIGGGSTEFAVGAGGGAPPDGVVSVDIGCVRITEKFLSSDPPAAEELSQALSVVHDHLDDVTRELPACRGGGDTRGPGGHGDDHGGHRAGAGCLRPRSNPSLRAHARRRGGRLPHPRHRASGTTSAQPGPRGGTRRRDRGRAPSCSSSIMRYFEFGECLVSEADILDGLVLSLL